MMHKPLLFLLLWLISPAIHADPDAPMFGGMDRQTNPDLAQQDAKFIAGATNTFGTREHASIGYVDSGFEAYIQNKDKLAMQRFNEAWLLNPDNPHVYVGFAVLYQKKKNYCDAMSMFETANSKELNDAGFLADYAFAINQCSALENANADLTLQAKATQIYTQAEQASNTRELAYVYQSWARSELLYKEYEKAKQKLEQAESLGLVSEELRNAIYEHDS